MILKAITQLAADDRGQDLVEYALLSGIFALAAILIFPGIASEMGVAYANWQADAQAIWEPCPPGGCP